MRKETKHIKEDRFGRVNPLYEERLIVLIEDIDKGVFFQVILNEKQYKKVSDAICKEISKDDSLKEGFELAEIEIGYREIPSECFNGMSSITE